jgi:hypothetical protein
MLERRYGIDLKPMSIWKRLLVSSSELLPIKGNLGYIIKRGQESDSLENQIASKISSEILFDHPISIKDIKREFSHIVVATGDNLAAKEHGVWTDTISAMARYAIVLGEFETGTAVMLLNTGYAKNCFAYLIPHSRKEASIVLIVNGVTGSEFEYYWKEFLSSGAIRYEIIETKDSEHICGFVSPHRTEKLFFYRECRRLHRRPDRRRGAKRCRKWNSCSQGNSNEQDYDKLIRPIARETESCMSSEDPEYHGQQSPEQVYIFPGGTRYKAVNIQKIPFSEFHRQHGRKAVQQFS